MSTKLFYSTKDIMEIVGCSNKQAQKIKKMVNDVAISKGMLIATNRHCSAELFNELFVKEKPLR